MKALPDFTVLLFGTRQHCLSRQPAAPLESLPSGGTMIPLGDHLQLLQTAVEVYGTGSFFLVK